MKKLTFAEKKKLEENLKYIVLPTIAHADDCIWIKLQLKAIHERYRQDIAFLYGKIFFKTLHDRMIPELQRQGVARSTTNTWLRTIVESVNISKEESKKD